MTEKPIDPVTATEGVPTWAVAVIVVAPTAAMPAEFKVTVATPEELVKAVAEGGVINAKTGSVANVRTELATNVPAASLNVAFTVAGTPAETEVTVAPAGLVSTIVIVGTGVVVGVPVPSDGTGVPPDPPEPQPASTASVNARKSDTENLEIPALEEF